MTLKFIEYHIMFVFFSFWLIIRLITRFKTYIIKIYSTFETKQKLSFVDQKSLISTSKTQVQKVIVFRKTEDTHLKVKNSPTQHKFLVLYT